jgi:hypothetical protein
MIVRRALSAVLLSLAVAASSHAAVPQLPRAGFLGVQAAPITEDVRTRLHLADARGVLVAGLVDGGTAKAAGLQPDDVIVAVGGQAVADPGELVRAIGRHRAGDRVAIRWFRAGQPVSAEVAMVPRPYESAPDTRSEYSAVRVGDTLRRTIVIGPKDNARHPAVLYLTGIGCFSQESLGVQSAEAKLLHGLARAGFVTMRVEKSGIGDSQGPPCASPQADFDAEVAAYVEGLKALKARADVIPDRTFVLGLSIGGVEAPLIAQREPVRGLVVVNTVAKGLVEYLVETQRRQSRLEGLAYDEVERRQRIAESCNHAFLVERQTPGTLVAARPECREFVEYPAPAAYVQQWAAVELAPQWKRVDVPVLIVQGEQDFVATVADAPLLRDIVESFHPGRATLVMVPGMDHFLSRAATMKESMARGGPGAFHEGSLEAIRAWLAAQSRG